MSTLSRTYRPKNFADITDQTAIKDTLRREVATKKVGHAYLFGGPRGVGKTTTARVFAKALNCLNLTDGEPCNACAACLELNEGRLMDVIEMDAASNTGVDNVREAIIEHVRFAPAGHAYKVYILDEAHMLSTSAWNALLKTLEEPPPYAVFILITTELHKVPATIQSRCQRFDFTRIPPAPLAERVRLIAKQEGATLDEDVVSTIVRMSDGCLRDAESLLGQLLVLGEKKVTSDIASLVLPVSRLPVAAELLSVLSKRELGTALSKVDELEDAGVPLVPLFDDVIEAVRELLRAADSVSARAKLADGSDGEKQLAKLVGVFEPAELGDMALLLMERRRDAKGGADARFCLELACAAVALGMLPHAGGGQGERVGVGVGVGGNREGLSKKETKPPAATVSSTAPAPSASAPTPTPTPTLSASPKPTLSAVSLTLNAVHAKWNAFIRDMDGKSPSLTFVLRVSRPIKAEGNMVTLEFQYPYHREKIVSDMKARRMVESSLAGVLNVPTVLIDGVVTTGTEEEKSAREAGNVNAILKAFGGAVMEEGNA